MLARPHRWRCGAGVRLSIVWSLLLLWTTARWPTVASAAAGFFAAPSGVVTTQQRPHQPSVVAPLFLFQRWWRNGHEKENEVDHNDNQNGPAIKVGSIRRKPSARWRRVRRFLRARLVGYTVYVLRCEGGKYYVGSTLYRRRRYRQHFGGAGSGRKGSAWTRRYRPLAVVEERRFVPERYHLGEENRVTAACMVKFGVNNVRGGMFARGRNYTSRHLGALKSFLGHYNQLSYPDLEKVLARTLPLPADAVADGNNKRPHAKLKATMPLSESSMENT